MLIYTIKYHLPISGTETVAAHGDGWDPFWSGYPLSKVSSKSTKPSLRRSHTLEGGGSPSLLLSPGELLRPAEALAEGKMVKAIHPFGLDLLVPQEDID